MQYRNNNDRYLIQQFGVVNSNDFYYTYFISQSENILVHSIQSKWLFGSGPIKYNIESCRIVIFQHVFSIKLMIILFKGMIE